MEAKSGHNGTTITAQAFKHVAGCSREIFLRACRDWHDKLVNYMQRFTDLRFCKESKSDGGLRMINASSLSFISNLFIIYNGPNLLIKPTGTNSMC
jgi:hypothetical protein